MMEAVNKVLGFFHEGDTFRRATFGVDRVTGGPAFIRWRVSDLLFTGLLFILYPLAYNIQPFQRQFYVDDLTISHPFTHEERVSGAALFMYAFWYPLAAIVVVSLIMTRPAHKIYVTYVSALGLAVSVFTTSIVTDVLKNSFGRLRPDFLARCIPKPDTPKGVLVFAKDVCTTENVKRLMDGFRTTPSGHSSMAFAGLLYLSFWLAGQVAVTSPQAGAVRWAVSFLPTLGAAMIALSRTEDYRHHFVDVFVGSCLGIVMANWSYFRLFPALRDERCHEPKLLLQDKYDSEYTAVGEV